MDAKIVNAFIDAAKVVVGNYVPQEISIGTLAVVGKSYPSEEMSVILGIIGSMRGEVTYGMTASVAQSIVSKMMGGMEINEMDEMALSALSELANMISGNAATNMSKLGLKIDLTPPTIITGQNVKFHTLEIKALKIPLMSGVGEIIMYIALQDIPE